MALIALGAAVILLAAACGSSTRPARGAGALARLPTDQPPVAPVSWSACAGGVQCARLVVPLDYHRPLGGTITVALTRLAALEPGGAGVLFFDVGGPAENGGDALRLLASFFPLPIRQHLDIVAMDRRGTGDSGKLRCGPSPAQVTGAPLAATSVLAALYQRTLPACRQDQAAVGSLDTVTAARDLDRARQGLGLDRIEFLGLSYGTLLGDTYAQLFASRVKAMILDGAVDPAESLLSQAADQAGVQERNLPAALSACAGAGSSCPPGVPLAAYRSLQQRLSSSPLPGVPPVGDGDLAAATLTDLTVPGLTPGYFPALAAARRGDGSELRSVAGTLYQDLDGTALIGPYWATTCEDSTTRPSPAALAQAASSLGAGDPDLGREAIAYTVAGCVGWPAPAEPLPAGPAAGAPPIVVIGGINDPQTPLAWARRVVAELGPGVGRLVVRENRGHTAFLNQPGPCVVGLETAYLLDRVVPPPLTTCPR